MSSSDDCKSQEKLERMLIQNTSGINKVYYGNVKVASYRLGSKFVPQNGPTMQFDTSVVHHSNTAENLVGN